MRLDPATAAQRRLLAELSGRISTRLKVELEKRPESLNIGVTLQERGKNGRLDIPYAMLQQAEADLTARDALRVRIKSARHPDAPSPSAITTTGGHRAAGRSGREEGRRLQEERRPRPALSP